MIIWLKWDSRRTEPMYQKINFEEERKKEFYRRINRILESLL